MFCTKCGNKMDDGAKFCNVCGAALEDTDSNKNNSSQKERLMDRSVGSFDIKGDKSKTFVAAFILFIFDFVVGGILAFYAFNTYSNDKNQFFGGYTYEMPLTGHEIMVIVSGVAGILLLIFGFIALFSIISESNKNKRN